jgi:Kef-type K+ transport system membrane component KefB
VLFFAWLAQAVGTPELLGRFAAGLALSQRFFLPFGLAIHTDPEFVQRVGTQMKPIKCQDNTQERLKDGGFS